MTAVAGPSVLLLRGIGDSLHERVDALLDVLPRVERVLSEGAVVVIEPDRYRIRHPPIDTPAQPIGEACTPQEVEEAFEDGEVARQGDDRAG